MDMKGTQALSVECKSRPHPMECMMSNWLGAWREISRDFNQVTTTAWRFRKLVFLAAKQIYCYELILKERRFLNEKLAKSIKAADNISSVSATKCYTLNAEWRKLLEQLVCLKFELGERNSALVKTKLELHCLRQKLQQQASKTYRLTVIFKQNKLLAEKLLDRNNILNERSAELLELYRTRTLTFIYKLIEMTEELISIKSRSNAIAHASAHLKGQNDELRMRQRMLHRKLAMRASQAENPKYSNAIIRNVMDCVAHFMAYLWACMSSLSRSPKLDGPSRRGHWSLVLI